PAPDADAATPLQALRDLGTKLGLGSGDDLLPVDEAFRMTVATPTADEVAVGWQIAPGYYLYRDKFKFTIIGNDSLEVAGFDLPPGKIKDDEIFGRVEVYHDNVEARVRFLRNDAAATEFTLVVGYQGCAEAGVCYPPQNKQVKLTLPAVDKIATTDRSTADSAMPAAPVTEQDRIAARLASGDTLLTLISFFGFGLLLAFTPCVFPMIPILSSIIVGQGRHITTGRAFSLSLAYVLAMALTYTAAGIIAGLTGENLQAAFQNPWILSAFAAVFVLLALSMFGFYDLQMPAVLQSRLSELSNRQKGGTLAGAAIMGFLSALIVGPCVAAPLAGALIYISQTGDPVLGGLALFALSLGMGVPLLAIGTGAGKFLPQAGDWMNAIKAVFGMLLLAVAIWMLERILPVTVSLLLWAALLIISAVYLGALERLDVDATGWQKLRKGFGVLVLAYGIIMLVGVAAGARDIYQPLRGTFAVAGGGGATAQNPATLQFRTIKSLSDLEAAIAEASAQGKTVMIDFYADWCTECHRMEKYTFSDPAVQAALANSVLLKADVTANDDIDKALLKHFGLIGPPSILFFDRNGLELSRHRVMGYMAPEEFAAHIRAAFGE
ncbi:protein-disulfide reductase DsbD, partial [Thiohalobacter sp.]|uniref:protein-disulfide reductase DsbD n=1 Tax=Thiohalobacter sp. TaxID=2025948 RepID=UPI002614FC65